MAERGHYWGMMTPRQVRIASLVASAGLACHYLVLPSIAVASVWVRLPLDVFAAMAAVPLLLWISVAAPGWRGVQPGEFDEREHAERAASFMFAHRAMGLIWLSVAFYGLRAEGWGLPMPAAATARSLLWSLAWVHLAMPGIVLAWRDGGEAVGVDDMDHEIG
ncbi:hypothetical protein [Polymorphobacter fuscus]|uniref:Uncharacterized protein n=1 Tax=Sandarakinorhabdus fusca TaxID=1439888 RepID=A0A7C9KH20_9SPHN|nr:hypothetical protein [Polymorphobacter fuscus]KAB7648949.1 hypothetical protein F9290_04610 [Polymorphobacter fuscus]MQT16540.1 hypothetical protein [Polymorphobacter fuscus]NJC07169.1 hypothetical protein [Polymorphobacter fuscus]